MNLQLQLMLKDSFQKSSNYFKQLQTCSLRAYQKRQQKSQDVAATIPQAALTARAAPPGTEHAASAPSL